MGKVKGLTGQSSTSGQRQQILILIFMEKLFILFPVYIRDMAMGLIEVAVLFVSPNDMKGDIGGMACNPLKAI